ncbi:MAG: S8 family peptidase [Prosthecobacter sp.]
MRTNRLPIIVFTAALALMAMSVGWLALEMNRGPVVEELPRAKAPSTSKARKGNDAKPGVAEPQGALSAAAAKSSTDAAAAPKIEPLNGPDTMPDEALLTFRTPEALAAFRDRAAALGLEVLGYDTKLRTARVRFKDAAGLEKDLAEHASDYAHVGPNYVVRVPGLPAAEAPTDTANAGGRVPFRSQGLDAIGAAANRAGWGQGVTVAVIDSGISSHSSLQNTQVTHIDMVNDGGAMNGHGTAMASLIAGNDANVGGVSPAARLLDIRVTDANGDSNTALLSSAIVKATDLGARVINVSLGSSGNTPMLEEAVRYAQKHNVVIVAAAGNEQQSALSMPAGYSGVLSVGAVDANGTQAYFSNSGNGLTLVAPGVGIVSGYTDSKLVMGSGTSQATAITSGVVAYLLGRGYYSANIIPLLTRTARTLNAPATAVGAGLIQVAQ